MPSHPYVQEVLTSLPSRKVIAGWAESCVGSCCVTAPNLRCLGLRSVGILGILDIHLHAGLRVLASLTSRIFPPTKLFTFFQRPLLPFENSQFLFLKAPKPLVFQYKLSRYRSTTCDQLPNWWFCLVSGHAISVYLGGVKIYKQTVSVTASKQQASA